MRSVLVLGLFAALGCSSKEPPPRPNLAGPLPYESLSEYAFFVGDLRNQEPTTGVYEFEPNAVLWSDHADKRRFVVMPDETAAASLPLDDACGDAPWDWPVRSILIKSFAFRADFRDPASPSTLVETRLLIREADDWTGHVYRWNDHQDEATRLIAGDEVPLTYVDDLGVTVNETYIVPDTNACKKCHELLDDKTRPLGGITAQLNRTVSRDGEVRNQLEWLAGANVLRLAGAQPAGLSAWAQPFGSAPVDERARAYLGANCSHCHRPDGGKGGSTGLDLRPCQMDPAKAGACKSPVAAGSGAGGLAFDIVPGSPDESILVFRMSSTDPDIKMPELPNRVVDRQGLQLIEQWISGMQPPGCAP